MKRIGLVIPTAKAYSETFFKNKIDGLLKHDFELSLFVGEQGKFSNPDLEIYIAPKLSGNTLRVLIQSFVILIKSIVLNFKRSRALYNLDKKDGVDFNQRIKNIIANYHILNKNLDWLHFGYGTMTINRENVAKAMGAKMAVSFRGFDIGIYPVKNPGCYNKLWNKIDKIHIISDDIGTLLSRNGYHNQSRIEKITPAIDVSHFNLLQNEIDFSDINLITVCRLEWKKGLEYTLEALAEFKRLGYNFKYKIVGQGKEEERLKFAVNQLNLEHEVEFMGRVNHNQLKKLLSEANIYLQFSLQEGFSNAVLEAQAMGLLCIVSDAEGLSENVLNEKTGWVVPKRDKTKLIERLISVVNLSKEEKLEIIEKASKRVVESFNLNKQQEEFISFYIDNY